MVFIALNDDVHSSSGISLLGCRAGESIRRNPSLIPARCAMHALLSPIHIGHQGESFADACTKDEAHYCSAVRHDATQEQCKAHVNKWAAHSSCRCMQVCAGGCSRGPSCTCREEVGASASLCHSTLCCAAANMPHRHFDCRVMGRCILVVEGQEPRL